MALLFWLDVVEELFTAERTYVSKQSSSDSTSSRAASMVFKFLIEGQRYKFTGRFTGISRVNTMGSIGVACSV